GRHRPPLLRRRPISSRAPADVAVARRVDAGEVDVEDYSSKRPFPSRLRTYLLVSGNGGNQDSRRTIQLSQVGVSWSGASRDPRFTSIGAACEDGRCALETEESSRVVARFALDPH